ncbi:MAG: cytochrome c family protein, partial [Motiliproteus sp.]|nr:cytochrome c family protein [Motiliproteus sp.]
HPFQFQSTVFPAVSIIDLTPGQEQEKVKRRKQLFKQINIIGKGNRTRIVSNPSDAEFSEDGKKVYITLAGSEDLMVFDLSRRAKAGKKRSKRRKGKLNQGGAKVTQILRHIPGDNPRGLVINDSEIYVQNANSHNIIKLDSGGSSPFARVNVKHADWITTVQQDPLSPDLRAGTRLFHSANTDDFSDMPTTGDFWMSCNSCHLDGFNFTNRYLMEANGRDKHEDAHSGHKNLSGMIAGQRAKDFLRIIQDTQGGLGHDDRDGALNIDADNPPAPALAMMDQLNQFVRKPENLPYLSTWLRINKADNSTPYVHPEEWINSASCRDCHSDLFDQWADSNHRLMGESNPYFKVLVELAGEIEGEEFKGWCLGCHMPHNVTTGNLNLGKKSHMFEKGATSIINAFEQNKIDLDEGTGCLFCHRIVDVEDAGGNAAFRVDLENREQYWLEDSDSDAGRWLAEKQINSRPEVHARSYILPVYKDPKYCQACHDEFSPGLGADIVDTYGEWEQSSFNNPEDPSKHRTCIDCHMHGDIDRIGEPVPGLATDGGKVQENLITHQFTGANHHLVGLRNAEQERMSLQLLRSSAELEQRLENSQLVVRVNNTGAGHALPTGVADFRQFWIQLEITDGNGQSIMRQGFADSKGNLPVDTRLFMKVFGDAEGKPLGLKFWRYEKLLSDTRIPADGYRDEAFDLPQDLTWPIKVTSRLMYRIYPQWVTDAVRKSVPELPEPPIVELETIESTYQSPTERIAIRD